MVSEADREGVSLLSREDGGGSQSQRDVSPPPKLNSPSHPSWDPGAPLVSRSPQLLGGASSTVAPWHLPRFISGATAESWGGESE